MKRSEYVDGILKAVACLETDQLRLAYWMCRVLAMEPGELSQFGKYLRDAKTRPTQ